MTVRRTVATLPALAVAAALVLSACSDDAGSEGAAPAEGSADAPAADAFTPAENVRMIVPFSAGGGSDLAGRAIASGLEEVTGSTVTVENLVGGSGAVGYADLLGAEGDPNVLLASETALNTLPVVQDVPFDYESFTPIMKLGNDYTVVIVNPESPYESCTDVIEAAQEETLTAAVSGATGPDNIAWSLVEEEYGFEFQRVTFESSAEVITALLGNNVQVAAANPGEVAGQLESGDIKPLCALAPERYEYEFLADVPTGVEEGIDVDFAQWRGFIAPAGISEEARQFWIDAAREYAETDAYTEYIESNLLQPQVEYGDDFVAYLEEYTADVEAVLGDG